MFTKHASFDRETLDLLYRVYAEASREMHERPEGTRWDGSDGELIMVATRILNLAATGERDEAALKRGAMNSPAAARVEASGGGSI